MSRFLFAITWQITQAQANLKHVGVPSDGQLFSRLQSTYWRWKTLLWKLSISFTGQCFNQCLVIKAYPSDSLWVRYHCVYDFDSRDFRSECMEGTHPTAQGQPRLTLITRFGDLLLSWNIRENCFRKLNYAEMHSKHLWWPQSHETQWKHKTGPYGLWKCTCVLCAVNTVSEPLARWVAEGACGCVLLGSW